MSTHPAWLDQIDDLRRSREHVRITGNTRDRVYHPDLQPLGSETDPEAPAIPPRYLVESLASYFGRTHAVYCYGLDLGLTKLTPPGYPEWSTPVDAVQGRRPAEVLPALTPHLRNGERPVVLIVDNAQHIAPSSHGMTAALAEEQLVVLETLARWTMDDAIRRTQNVVVLIDHDGGVHPLLTQQTAYRTVLMPIPGEAERRAFLDHLHDLHERGRAEFADLPPDELTLVATESAGLRLVDLEALSRQSGASGAPITRDAVRRRKEQAISQLSEGLLQLVPAEYGLDAVAGQHHARDAFREIIAQWKLGDRNVPKGILLAGVPGQGKSFIVPAFAHDLGLPLLRFRSLRSPYVGESEARQERAFWIVDSMAPVVVEVDEIDQMVGKRSSLAGSGDSGTSERMLGAFLEFFGTEARRGRVILVAATNFPMGLDPAILDRMGVVIPFLPPSPDEIVELLPRIAQQLGIPLGPDVDVGPLAALPNLRLPTVRMLAEIVATAARRSTVEGGRPGLPVCQQLLEQAAVNAKPNYDPLMMERIALEAVRMTSMEHLLPWRTWTGWRDGYTLPPYLEGLVDDHGRVRTLELQRRLSELASLTGV